MILQHWWLGIPQGYVHSSVSLKPRTPRLHISHRTEHSVDCTDWFTCCSFSLDKNKNLNTVLVDLWIVLPYLWSPWLSICYSSCMLGATIYSSYRMVIFLFFFFPPLGKKSEKFSSGLFNFRAVSCTEKGHLWGHSQPSPKTPLTLLSLCLQEMLPLLVSRDRKEIYIYIKKNKKK